MRLKKAKCEQVRLKYGGHCAYCGALLGDRWRADHLELVIRVADERIAEQMRTTTSAT
ncbi:hypothetical protein [Pseudomonas granadensis]|uniref:hypothetical protein n=1 Tax=Pseudomonas granadensis TaxID=1421430 RepID=UPI001F14D568|nr:hypothetical protein [Pseudomonas granadensis]